MQLIICNKKQANNFNFTKNRGKYSYETKWRFGKLIEGMKKECKSKKELRGVYSRAIRKFFPDLAKADYNDQSFQAALQLAKRSYKIVSKPKEVKTTKRQVKYTGWTLIACNPSPISGEKCECPCYFGATLPIPHMFQHWLFPCSSVFRESWSLSQVVFSMVFHLKKVSPKNSYRIKSYSCFKTGYKWRHLLPVYLVLEGFHEITADIPQERGWKLKKTNLTT